MSVSSSLVSGETYIFKHKLTKNEFKSQVFVGFDGSAFLSTKTNDSNSETSISISKKELENFDVTHLG